MAEFKLGRIRFVWQGEWMPTTSYVVDDVVRNGGTSYICTVSHTSSNLFVTDYNVNDEISKWNIISEGLSWKGDWDTDTYYGVGDQVKYGGLVYVCNEAHTSAATLALGLEDDQAKWDLLASSFFWTGNWATERRYRINDFVVYGGVTYFCNTAHTSAATVALGLEADQAKWTVFNNGFTFTGDWADTVRYRVNDVVKYGASTWICVSAHTSAADFDDTKWNVFVEGLEFEDTWSDAAVYQVGDVVTYGGYSYIAKRNNTNSNPFSGVEAAQDWQIYTTGFNFSGDWNSTTAYQVGDVVRVGGFTYLAIADSTDETPPNIAFWERLNSGTKWTNVQATYTGVTGVSQGASIGAGAEFTVSRSKTVYSVTVTSGGTNYQVNDKILVDGTDVGGISPANDLTLTVTDVTDGAVTAVTASGYSVSWTSGTSYVQGDIVFFGASSYICVLEHTASGLNRPDADTSATYWNLFAAGSESAVLTVEGDTYYYGANGPTRLPIGTDGQVLRVTNGYPSWSYYGVINNVVYVAPNGVDDLSAGRGLTIDKPWKTIRFAAMQVEKGYRNTNAGELLKKNKQFLMKEVSNWVTSTYSVTVTASSSATNQFTSSDTTNLVAGMPIQFDGSIGGVTAGTKYFVRTVTGLNSFTISNTQFGTLRALTTGTGTMTGSLAYDYDLCQRDVGILVDAVTFDLTHGGNEEVTKAARAYYTTAGSAYITSNFGQQTIQTVAAYNYLKDIISNVLNNVAPETVYQTVNGIPTEQQAIQIIDQTILAEDGTDDQAQALLGVVTDGIVAGVLSAIPAAIFSNTTISAKTGTYYEVLPITIPKNTALVGDELRSTVVSPSPAIANLASDKPKTISALHRIKSVLPNIVANNSIVPSTGNTEVQQFIFEEVDSVASARIRSNVAVMTDVLANGTTSAPVLAYPDPTGYDSGYLNARRLILANKDFLKAEVTAWINTQIAGNVAPFVGFVYDQVKCERDVGYIVDGLAYDLTYQGNLATVIAARSYYSNGVLVEVGEEDQAKALWTYVKSIVDDIATGVAITKSSGNAATQDVSGTAGSAGAATFAQTRIQEIHDTIDTGVTPATIAPSTAWVDGALVSAAGKIDATVSLIQSSAIEWVNATFPGLVYNNATCSRDVGYIVDALKYDMLFGSNFLSTWNAMSYYRSLASTEVVLNSQLEPTISIVGFVASSLKEVVSGVSGLVGKVVAAERIATSADVIYDIMNNGIAGAPTEVITDPTNLDIDFENARTQLANNYAFIKADVSQYIQNTYPAVWTALGAPGQAACQRDVGYILDAIRYDLTYGGNTQTLIAGSAYYSGLNLTINATEKTATLAAYTHLKSIIDDVSRRLTVTPQAGNLVSQVVSGTGGDATAATFAQDRVQDVMDWITNGVAPTAIAPDTSWVDPALVTGYATLQARKSEIQLDGLGYVQKFHQELAYDKELCSRDIGLMVDGIGYDMMFGSNFAAITIGRSYHRALTSTQTVLTTQKNASLGLVKFLKYKLKGYAVGGAIAKVATVIDDIIGTIDGGATPRFLWPSYASVDVQDYAGAKLIWENKEFIQAEVLAYITANYPAITYNKELCARDVGYIVDALRYDLTYTGNVATRQAGLAYYSALTDALQIDSADKAATLAAYGQMKTVVSAIASGGVYSALQANVTRLTGTSGDATTATTVGTLIDGIIATINDVNNVPAEVLPGTAWVDSLLVTQAAALESSKASIQSDVTAYINETYPNLVYDSVTCARDVGYIVDALRYDLMFGSNFRSVKSGMSYYQAQASKVLTAQKRATLNAYRFLKDKVKAIVSTNATALASVNANMTAIINIIDHGIGETPDVNGSTLYHNSLGSARVAEAIRANIGFLETESTSWIKQSFGGFVTSTTSAGSVITTASAHNLSVGDPVIFDARTINTSATSADVGTDVITVLTTEGMLVGSKITFTGAGFGNIQSAATYYIKTIDSATTLTISDTYNGAVFDLTGVFNGPVSVTAGGTIGGLTTGVQYYVATVPAINQLTIVEELGQTTPLNVTTDSGTLQVTYSFDDALCKRDMREYLNAIIEDISMPGNYRGAMAALLYNNAVAGSEASDMFWVSNASGLRNCTLSGLSGDLTELNDYGTRRPTAGAFVALNPGFGPMDSRVWVTSRSHYSQNVTMFGTGCTGAKIDAALHRYGNKSMVKNDFTTIISDGIGVWCTGQDSLTELVSVFNYYGYSGYLAELGGRIRATNGNSSYGTYGVIAEGVDAHEQPIYGTVNNKAFQAQITSTVTDGINEILRLEFANAGSNYSNTTYTISGTGYNAEAIGDEFRDAAVFETRIVDLDDANGVGGTSYVTQSNAAQSGDATSITIAATDTALNSAYVGMRIQIIAGTGAGQYANVLTYGAGSKIATVYKDSFVPLTITATTDAGDLFTTSSNATLYAGMPIYFTGTVFGNVVENAVYYVKVLTGSTQFTVSETLAGPDFNASTATGTMTVLAAGWDHAVPGTAIENALDLTTQYIIEPSIKYTEPGYTATARTVSASANWSGLTYGDNKYVAVADASTVSTYSTDGVTWASAGSLPSSSNWTDVVYGGGAGAKASVVIGGLGGAGAVLQAVLGVPNTTGAATQDQVATVRIINGGQGYTTPPVIKFTPVSGGTGAVATCAVLNGEIVSVTVTVPGSGYAVAPTVTAVTDRVTDITIDNWGRNYFSTPSVTVADPFAGAAWTSGGSATTGNYIYYVNSNDKNWYYVTAGGTFTTSGPIHTSGSAANGSVTLQYVGTTARVTPLLVNSGVNGYTIAQAGSGYTSVPTITVLDTSAKYVAIATGSGDNCYTTRAGIAAGSAWTSGTGTGKSDLTSIAYGNGVYVAVGGTNSAVSSTNGTLWTTRTIPTLGAGSYSSVAYGAEMFLAINNGGVATAISANGNSWAAGGNLPNVGSNTWTSVAYGNGRFVAIQANSNTVAYSIDRGLSWSLAPAGLGSTQAWQKVSYGQGLFIATASSTNVCATSPDGVTWTLKSLPSSGAWENLAFGNTNDEPTWVAIRTSNTNVAASIKTGARALGRVRVASGVVTEVRMVEPGSGYPKGTLTGTSASGNTVLVGNTTNLVANQPVVFDSVTGSRLEAGKTYYVVGGTITGSAFGISLTPGGAAIVLNDVSLAGSYRAGPIYTLVDPNKVKTAALEVRLGDGALGNPSFTNRGTDMATATTEPNGDGYSDLFQPSSFINIAGLYDIPEAGANVEFSSLPGVYFKLVVVTNELGELGNKTAQFQINPALTVLQAPKHGDVVTTRIKYSQVRLTGHDFLYIGTGGKEKTNYPNVDISTAIQANQAQFSAGGRVFFTSTDQDGNFNVGNLFGVQQATGTATLNASAFNLSGLNSLQLGAVELGVGSAIITQFSTDPFFTADSDNIVPTQRAIKAYITAQIGGGQSSLNVNTLTSGIVYIAGNTITTTTGEAINVTSKMNFTGGIDGAPVALGFFMQR